MEPALPLIPQDRVVARDPAHRGARQGPGAIVDTLETFPWRDNRELGVPGTSRAGEAPAATVGRRAWRSSPRPGAPAGRDVYCAR